MLGVLAAAAGLAGVTSGGGQSLVAFAAVATVAAGAETEWPQAIAVTVAGILPIWIVGPIVGSSLGTLAGYPLLIAATLSFGRNRRSYRVQAEQAAALLEQYERVRAEQRRADVLDERTRIAREIHDVLAHSLGALGIQIQAAKAVLTDHRDIDRAVEVLSTAQRMAADGLTETRRAVHALRVDSLPLGDELAGGGRRRTGSATRFRSPSRPTARPGRCRPTPPSRCSGPCRRPWSTRPSTRPGAGRGPPRLRPRRRQAHRRQPPRRAQAAAHAAEQRRRLRADRDARAAAAAERHPAGRPARRRVGGDGRTSASVGGHERRIAARPPGAAAR